LQLTHPVTRELEMCSARVHTVNTALGPMYTDVVQPLYRPAG
jgi:hypothetical protein